MSISVDADTSEASPRFYAGVGSRQTPDDVLELMRSTARALAAQGFVLRGGHAEGADLAFEQGLASLYGDRPQDAPARIYVPWRRFNAQHPVVGRAYYEVEAWTEDIAQRTHPVWYQLKRGPRTLHMRNVHQMLGHEAEKVASSFVICWTPDGATTAEETSSRTGGTGQAIRLADHLSVPVFNLQRTEHRERVEYWLDSSQERAL